MRSRRQQRSSRHDALTPRSLVSELGLLAGAVPGLALLQLSLLESWVKHVGSSGVMGISSFCCPPSMLKLKAMRDCDGSKFALLGLILSLFSLPSTFLSTVNPTDLQWLQSQCRCQVNFTVLFISSHHGVKSNASNYPSFKWFKCFCFPKHSLTDSGCLILLRVRVAISHKGTEMPSPIGRHLSKT